MCECRDLIREFAEASASVAIKLNKMATDNNEVTDSLSS